MKWGARISLEGEDWTCSRDLTLSREAREREAGVVWTWSYQMTNTPVWSCYSMRWSKRRWAWWVPSRLAPLPAVTQDLLRRFCLKLIFHRFVFGIQSLSFFASFFKLSVKKIFSFAWSLGHQGKDKISLQNTYQFLVFICSLFEQQTVNLKLGMPIISCGEDSGHFEFKNRGETRTRLLIIILYLRYILIFSGCVSRATLKVQMLKTGLKRLLVLLPGHIPGGYYFPLEVTSDVSHGSFLWAVEL